MVRGLAIFQEWFKDFENQYILIGGTAAKITMNAMFIPNRRTNSTDSGLNGDLVFRKFRITADTEEILIATGNT